MPNDCSNIANKYDIKIDGANKLMPNLGNKSKYVLQYGNLQLYLSWRMKWVVLFIAKKKSKEKNKS